MYGAAGSATNFTPRGLPAPGHRPQPREAGLVLTLALTLALTLILTLPLTLTLIRTLTLTPTPTLPLNPTPNPGREHIQGQ